MSNMNRLALINNPYQGKYKKVLCVCSAGLLRSPTAAMVLSQEPFNFNTRSAGISTEFALTPVDEVLLHWADEIVCMEAWQCNEVYKLLHQFGLSGKLVTNLDIEDSFSYRDPALINAIRTNYSWGHTLNERRSAGTGNDGTRLGEETTDTCNGSTEAV